MTTDTSDPMPSTRPSELSSDRLIAAAQSHLEELSKLLPADYSCTLKISYPQGGGWVLTARAVACMQPEQVFVQPAPARESQEVRAFLDYWNTLTAQERIKWAAMNQTDVIGG